MHLQEPWHSNTFSLCFVDATFRDIALHCMLLWNWMVPSRINHRQSIPAQSFNGKSRLPICLSSFVSRQHCFALALIRNTKGLDESLAHLQGWADYF